MVPGLLRATRLPASHRDLAARNVLIAEELAVKISDYGLSRDVSVEKEYYRMQTFGRPIPLR